MRKLICVWAAVCLLASAAVLPARAEIQLPPDVMASATEGINGVYSLDFATADKNIAQAKAEERRAMAVAQEQEMRAKAQQARAEVIQAEAEVPKALAQALREGNMGFMDYYKLENLKGDTAMRDAISKFDPNSLLNKK